MRRAAARRPAGDTMGVGLRAALLLALLTALPACSGSNDHGGGDSGLKANFSSSAPAGGSAQVVWMAEGGAAGGLQQVDVVSRDLIDPFDSYHLEISFDPAILEPLSAASGSVFLACGQLNPPFIENVANGNAAASGTILISESLPGASPTPCPVPGGATLAHVVFKAKAAGMSPLDFIAYNQDPNAPAGSRLARRNPDVASIQTDFFDGAAAVEVR